MGSSPIIEGIGWAALGFATRMVFSRGLGAGEGSSDIAGLVVPMGSALLAGRDLGPAAVGGAVGVAAGSALDRAVGSTGRFIVWGDSHGNAHPRVDVIARMALEKHVDAFVFLGDAEGWDRWISETEPLRKVAPSLAVPGNHDDPAGQDVLGVEVPGVYRIAGATCVFLPDPPTKRSVEEVIDAADPGNGPLLVFLHRSPIAFSEQNSSGVTSVRKAVEPLLDAGCVMLTGHHHVYAWGAIANSNVVTCGIAGSKHYRCACTPPCVACDDQVRGYVRVDTGPGKKVSATLVVVES